LLAVVVVRPGRIHGENDRTDQGGIDREPGDNEFRRERHSGAEGFLQAGPQAIP
jgi:hypothetical protein